MRLAHLAYRHSEEKRDEEAKLMNPSWDMPQNYYFGGAAETLVTPLALVVLLLSSILLITLPRRRISAVGTAFTALSEAV